VKLRKVTNKYNIIYILFYKNNFDYSLLMKLLHNYLIFCIFSIFFQDL